ncbi:DUF3042 domain-containing protein [Floricoccus tropicus]|uniref:DUF3042 domain-containing protein n=2 Tax=Floricoccus TaxID=1930830 RepID=A0A1E8GJA2_9LACT|nr:MULTISPECIES: DUF3042 family protein [Floricoccus]OFI46454.1 DUF3042 domain-containing protein [Floricoccus penangensis]OFI48311.1 DUF3042 domain-containing protein [Floricoccus tropicus]URZ87188.1 DUF3042 family protein [Floricoccus penangensis]
MKKFTKGVLAGVASSVAIAATGALTYKKKVIDPELEKEAFVEDNRRKAARKRTAR